MWIFSNKKKDKTIASFSWLKQDIHSHLLPGIDDGSPDVQTSIEYLRSLSDAGIKKFVCTPHIFGDMYRNDPDTIHSALNKLKAAADKECLDITLSAAAEYMLDDYFMQLLHSGTRLMTLHGNYLLTELPYTIAPGNIEEMTFEIITSDYQPILAHPERYGYYHKNLKAYHRLKELGYLFQMNLLSLTGYYGGRVAATAKMLLKENLVDFVGTDLHHGNHLNTLIDERSQRIFDEHLGDRVFNEFP